MKLSRFICPWCDVRQLHYVEAHLSHPDSTVSISGIKLACSDPTDQNCPDTTGLCKTEEEADGYAVELCEEIEVKKC